MESVEEKLSDDAETPHEMEQERSKSQILKIERSRKNVSIMMSESKKNRRRTSDSPRVVFADQEPVSVSSNEELVQETNDTESKDTETIATTEMEDDVWTTDSHDALREIQVRTKKHLDSQPEMSGSLAGPSKVDESEGFASRRRSTVFLGYTIEEMFAQHAQTPRHSVFYGPDESGSFSSMTTEIGSPVTPGGRARFSENVGVKSMIFDIPSTDSLPHLEARAFGVILQEALDQLGILERVIPAKVDPRWDESYKTIDEKYGTPDEPEIMFRNDMGLLPLVPTVSEKLQRDRTYMYNVLKSTIRDIQCVRRYDRLETEVDDITRILEGEHNLEVNNEIWTGQVTQLRELIESERLKNDGEVKNLLLLAQDMNAEVDNAIFSNKSKLEYVERWEAARIDQQKLNLEIREQEINDALEKLAISERDDQIISSEISAFLQANTLDLEESIIAWSTRYNEETERLTRQMNDTKEKIELQKIRLENLRELKNEQQIFLHKCYEEQRLAEREVAYWEAVNRAATLIQSLWRGYMVRHKLGRYEKLWASLKKRKDKKKKKKKGKKRNK